MAIAGEKVYEATIGSALAQRREKLGLSRVQAADHIGMSRTTYSSYERDTQRPSVDVFPVLAGFLDVSMDDFLVLYGATSIAAVRPSLERLLAEPRRSHRVEAVDNGVGYAAHAGVRRLKRRAAPSRD